MTTFYSSFIDGRGIFFRKTSRKAVEKRCFKRSNLLKIITEKSLNYFAKNWLMLSEVLRAKVIM